MLDFQVTEEMLPGITEVFLAGFKRGVIATTEALDQEIDEERVKNLIDKLRLRCHLGFIEEELKAKWQQKGGEN